MVTKDGNTLEVRPSFEGFLLPVICVMHHSYVIVNEINYYEGIAMAEKSVKTASERQASFVKRREKEGFKRKVVWIKPKHNRAVDTFVEQLYS